MGKALIIIFGLIFVAAGAWAISAWHEIVVAFIGACVALGLVVLGLGMLAFGWSEIRSAQEERRLAAEVDATPPIPQAGQPKE